MEKQSAASGPVLGGKRMVLSGHNFLQDSKVIFVEKAPGIFFKNRHRALAVWAPAEVGWQEVGAGGHGCHAQSWATAHGAGRRGAAGAGPAGGCALQRDGPASAWLAGASLVGSDQLLLPGLPVWRRLLVSQNHRPSKAGAWAWSGHGS